ncbi:MAG TPA: histone H1-like repetitive region-containing protein [Acidimicrobiales bacterium]|nr:histone H1-like repetitive region-containing protein [Acidimicrobiales bacterium]
MLVAIVLLVLGLLAGTGLALIYASIASSLAAGIVLVVAKVAGRPTEQAPARPTPARETEPVGAGTTASFPAPSPAETTAPVPVATQEPSYAPTSRQPAMAGAAVGAGGAAALGGVGEDEEEDEDFFPIEDYDRLKVSEIVPLLPELYEDELDMVEQRERAGKGRVSILNRIAELREQPLEDEAEPEPEPDLDTAVVVVPEGSVAEDDEDFFPIEDYDELSVGEILPLLPELYEDELDVVEDRERATKNRAAVLNRLAELRDEPLAAEPEPVAAPAPAEDEVELEDELEDEDFFPIEDYDELSVGEILPLLPELYDDELDVVEDRERTTKQRAAILNRITELREEPLEDEPELDTAVVVPAEAPVADEEDFFPIEDYDELKTSEVLPLLPELYDDELDVVEDRERATKNRAAVLDRLAELRLETEPEPAVGDVDDEVLEDADQEQVAPAAAFPIGNYEQLRVSQIRALLPQLSEDELEQVRRREQDGKNRSTVLAAIDRELGVAPPAPTRKAPSKKAAAKKTAAKKTAARGTTPKKAAAATAPTAKKAPTKKVPSKKAPAKKTAAKKTTAKKTAAPAKRVAAPAKKTAARGTTAKKATTKKAAGKKATRRS